MNGVGGDNVWLIYDGRREELLGLNAAGRSAAAVDADRYRASHGVSMPTRGGAVALTVPGAVSGWWEAHRFSRDELGSPIAWRTLFDDAIAHARDGIAASTGQRRVTEQAKALFTDDGADEIRKTFWPVSHPDRLPAERFTQSDLARTLELIAEGGAEEFYAGELAGRIAHVVAAVGNPLRAIDFARHRADWVEPLRARYRGGETASLPPPTQGFAARARILVVGCGTGRDLIALVKLGYRAEGLDVGPRTVTVARRMLETEGLRAEFYTGPIEAVALPGSFDAFIFSWFCYCYIPQADTRIGVLRKVKAHLHPGGRILISYIPAERPPRWLPIRLTQLGGRISGSDWRPEPGDVVGPASDWRRIHYEHQFQDGELEEEAHADGLTIVFREKGAAGTAVLTA